MSWSLDTSKVDVGFVNPPVGRKRYKITDASLVLNKKDPKGKEQFLSVKIKDGSSVYSVTFYVMSADETQARIANQNLTKLWFAAGLSGVIKPERLKTLVGKEAILDFQPSKKDAKYINFAGAWPVDADEPEAEEEPSEEEEEEEETTEEEDDVPPTASKQPWLKKK